MRQFKRCVPRSSPAWMWPSRSVTAALDSGGRAGPRSGARADVEIRAVARAVQGPPGRARAHRRRYRSRPGRTARRRRADHDRALPAGIRVRQALARASLLASSRSTAPLGPPDKRRGRGLAAAWSSRGRASRRRRPRRSTPVTPRTCASSARRLSAACALESEDDDLVLSDARRPQPQGAAGEQVADRRLTLGAAKHQRKPHMNEDDVRAEEVGFRVPGRGHEQQVGRQARGRQAVHEAEQLEHPDHDLEARRPPRRLRLREGRLEEQAARGAVGEAVQLGPYVGRGAVVGGTGVAQLLDPGARTSRRGRASAEAAQVQAKWASLGSNSTTAAGADRFHAWGRIRVAGSQEIEGASSGSAPDARTPRKGRMIGPCRADANPPQGAPEWSGPGARRGAPGENDAYMADLSEGLGAVPAIAHRVRGRPCRWELSLPGQVRGVMAPRTWTITVLARPEVVAGTREAAEKIAAHRIAHGHA